MTHPDAGLDGPDDGDTEICAVHSLGAVVRMLAATRRLLSLEVGALVAMELCERALEGSQLGLDAVQLDVIGHLRVTRALRPDDHDLLGTLESWGRAIHPSGRERFGRAHRNAPAALRGAELALHLRDRFATLLFPIDRVSARTSLAGAIEAASREAQLHDAQRGPAPPDFDDVSTSRGIGPASVEHVLSGLDDTVFTGPYQRIEAYGGGFDPEETARFQSLRLDGADPPSLEVALLGPEPGARAERRVGRFAVFGRLGCGGMAEALLARNVEGGAPFVLKRLLPEAADDPGLLRMFEDEARLGLFLDHPHIARVLEYVPGAQPLMKMEWAPGLTLSKLMKRTREAHQQVPIEVVLRVGEAVSSALAYAHSARSSDGRPLRVVHRDVSPQNVVLQWDGQIKLLDFGVARSAVQAEHSEAGVIKGKFAYMAPEQSLGMPIDDRADVFCVGICLYEALSGKRLFDSDERLAAVRALSEGPIPDVRRHRPEVSETLARLVGRCLASDPENRPHMSELHEEIAALRHEAGARRQTVLELVRRHEPNWEDWRRVLAPGADGELAFAEAPPVQVPPIALAATEAQAPTLRPPPVAASGPSVWSKVWPVLLLLGSFVVGAGTYAGIRHLMSSRAETPADAPPLAPSTPGLVRATAQPTTAATPPAAATPLATDRAANENDAPNDDDALNDDDAPNDDALADDDAPNDDALTDEPNGEPEPAERATGTLLVRTRPAGARVTLDGVRLRGVTPQRWTIPAGSHRVQVFRAGHRPQTRHIVTEPDGGGLLDLRLRPR